MRADREDSKGRSLPEQPPDQAFLGTRTGLGGRRRLGGLGRRLRLWLGRRRRRGRGFAGRLAVGGRIDRRRGRCRRSAAFASAAFAPASRELPRPRPAAPPGSPPKLRRRPPRRPHRPRRGGLPPAAPAAASPPALGLGGGLLVGRALLGGRSLRLRGGSRPRPRRPPRRLALPSPECGWCAAAWASPRRRRRRLPPPASRRSPPPPRAWARPSSPGCGGAGRGCGRRVPGARRSRGRTPGSRTRRDPAVARSPSPGRRAGWRRRRS